MDPEGTVPVHGSLFGAGTQIGHFLGHCFGAFAPALLIQPVVLRNGAEPGHFIRLTAELALL